MEPASLYPAIKWLHVTTVIITGSLFILRFIWMLQGRLARHGGWVNTLPHYNDTVLFVSGLILASLLGQLPLQAPWLTTKLFVLLAYILLGTVALKRGRRLWLRAVTGAAAIGCYLYIISVALSRDPTPSLEVLLSRFGLA